MDIARINCAHDDPKAWRAMAKHVHHAAKSAKRDIKIPAPTRTKADMEKRRGKLTVANALAEIRLLPDRLVLAALDNPGALSALLSRGLNPNVFLTRHVTGDWLEMEPEDQEVNRRARQFRAVVIDGHHVSRVRQEQQLALGREDVS